MALDIETILNRLLQKWLPKIIKSINIDYSLGSAITITNAKIDGKQTTMSPLSLTKKEQETNINMINELIQGINNEVAKKINYLVNKSITEKWSTKMLTEELKKLNIEETYKNRIENIATTESFRLMNLSTDKTARELGYTKKYLFNIMDNRTAEDSKIIDRLYGGKDKAISINKPFTYTYKGKSYSFMIPPNRPRDRALVFYTNK